MSSAIKKNKCPHKKKIKKIAVYYVADLASPCKMVIPLKIRAL